jgi:hypothetical protein
MVSALGVMRVLLPDGAAPQLNARRFRQHRGFRAVGLTGWLGSPVILKLVRMGG